MTNLRLLPLAAAASTFCAVLSALTSAVSNAAPPEGVAALVGQWKGESSHTPAGESSGRRFSDARRYWLDGDVVRGELLSGAGDQLRSYRVAIFPRGASLLKIVAEEGGETELFLGRPGENGIVWSAVSADGVSYVERVVGKDGERRLEMLLAEESGGSVTWRLADVLKPTEAAFTAVIGDAAPGAEPVEVLPRPGEAELELIDRIAELMRQRDNARSTQSSVARELATAWRELEEARTQTVALEAQLGEAKRALAAAPEPTAQPDPALAARLQAAEEAAAQARTWADQMEKSLRDANARADQNAARMADLDRELAAAEAARKTAAGEAQTSRSEMDRLAARVQELEGQIVAAGQGRAGAEDELKRLVEARDALQQQWKEAQDRLETVSAEKAQLAARLTEMAAGAAQTSEAREKQRREVLASQAELQEKLRSAQEMLEEKSGRVRELEAMTAGLQQQLVGATTAAATAAELGAAQRAQRDAEAARDEAARALALLRQELEQARTGQAALEQQLAAARQEALRFATRVAELEQRASELAQSGAAGSDRQAAIEVELAASRAELSMANAREARVQQALDDARAAAEAAAAQSRQVETDLSSARTRVVELEREAADLRTRGGELTRALETARAEAEARMAAPTVDARVAQLEQRLADTFARSDERQKEIDRLNARVAELETDRQSLQAQVTAAAGGVAATADAVLLNRRLASAEAARLELEQQNTELTRRVRELETGLGAPEPARPAVAASRAPVAPAPRSTAPEPVRFQIPSTPGAAPSTPAAAAAAPAESATIRYRPTRPAGGEGLVTVAGDAQVAAAVQRLAVNGFRRDGANSLVVISGRTHRVGDVVDRARSLRFTRIDPDALVFTGPGGIEYRRPLQ